MTQIQTIFRTAKRFLIFYEALFGIRQALDSSCVHFDSQHTQRHPFAKPAENPEESGKLYIGMAILNL